MIARAPSSRSGGARSLARDPQFAIALAAGPCAWVAATAALGMHADPTWVIAEPLRFARLALAWPLLEEWLFRGALQPALARTARGARSAWHISTANVVASLAFAAAHLVSHSPEWAAATFAPSLVFGYFRERHRSVTPSAVLHVFYNCGWLLLIGA